MKCTDNVGVVKKNIELAKALSQAGLCAALPVLTADQREYAEEGGLCFYLCERLEGEQLGPVGLYEANGTEKARFIGSIIGQLHTALASIEAVVQETDLLEKVKSWALPRSAELLGLSETFCADYLAVFSELYPQLEKQIIHRDPNPGNIILCEEKWGFIDFDLSERNVRLYDPCYAATGILSETFSELDKGKRERWVEIYRSIRDGYDAVVQLTEAERRAMPYVLLANQFVCTAWFAEQETMQDLFSINRDMTKWILAHFEELKP